MKEAISRVKEDDDAKVKGEALTDASPPKKQKTADPKSGRPKAAKKVWDDAEMTAFWKSIYGLVKENIPGLMQNPEVDQVFASLTGKKK